MNIKKLFNKKTIIISLLFVLSLTLFAVLNISTTYLLLLRYEYGKQKRGNFAKACES